MVIVIILSDIFISHGEILIHKIVYCPYYLSYRFIPSSRSILRLQPIPIDQIQRIIHHVPIPVRAVSDRIYRGEAPLPGAAYAHQTHAS